MFNLGRSLQAKGASIIRGGCGVGLEVGRLPDESRDDFVIWLPQGNGDFSVTFAWTAIREIYPIIEWHGVVWFGSRSTCHVGLLFPGWLFNKSLRTCDRLIDWGLRVDEECCICHPAYEPHSQLFFSCSFTLEVWVAVGRKNGAHLRLQEIA